MKVILSTKVIVNIFKQMIVPNKNKKDQSIELEPWPHEEEPHHHFIGEKSAHSRGQKSDSIPFSHHQVQPTGYQRNFESSRPRNSSQGKNSLSEKKSTLFIDKNKADLQSYNYYRNIVDYSDIFDYDFTATLPFNSQANTINHFYRRPLVNTTIISYYDEEERARTPKDLMSKMLRGETRPKSSSTRKANSSIGARNKHESSNNSMIQKKKRVSPFSSIQCQTPKSQVKKDKINAHHFQKMLKLKQKLRQKIKNNSNWREIQRNYYMNMKKMTIQQSIRNSSKVIEVQNPEKSYHPLPTDRWRLQTQKRSKHSLKKKQFSNNFFSVKGGAIYK